MRDFTKVSPLIWRDKRFLGLASSDARLLYFYFLTGEHQNPCGSFRIPDGYASSDLQWEAERYVQARDEVVGSGLAKFDPETSEIYVSDWYETNPICNDSHYKGALKGVCNIESDMIREIVEPEIEASEQRRKKVPEKQSRLEAVLFRSKAH
jgi:hypothetical protein